MLNIKIDNPELEANIKQTFGNDSQSLAEAFASFISKQRIKQDIGVSIRQLEAGEGVPITDVMEAARRKYE